MGLDSRIAAVGPGSQNAMIWDFVAGNPASGYFQQQRVAGVVLDARDGAAMKTVAHGTITPYNSPTASAVPAGLQFVGTGDITIESVHTENVQDGILCEGDLPQSIQSIPSNLYAGCWILSTDPGTGVATNTVHLGPQVGTAFVNTVTFSNGPFALEDDTSTPGVQYTASGTYILGYPDFKGGLRMTLLPQPGQLQVFDGPLFLNNGLTASAGSLGFAPGLDVGSSVWPSSVPTAVIEAPSSVSSYRLTLPGGPASGVLQGSFPGSPSSLVTGTFSGDSGHSIQSTNNTTLIVNSPLCLGSVCSLPGLYHIHWVFIQATACTGSGSGITFQLTWTDTHGTSHTQTLPMFDGSSLTVPSGVFHLQPSPLTSSFPASGDFNIYKSASTDIRFTTGGTVCSFGAYDLYATVTQLQ